MHAPLSEHIPADSTSKRKMGKGLANPSAYKHLSFQLKDAIDFCPVGMHDKLLNK